MSYRVIPTKIFEKDIKTLKRKYPLIKKDLEDAIAKLEAGDFGDIIQPQPSREGRVFKMRMKNSSTRTGTRGGFRLITAMLTDDNEIYLLSCYSKTNVNDISSSDIANRIKDILE